MKISHLLIVCLILASTITFNGGCDFSSSDPTDHKLESIIRTIRTHGGSCKVDEEENKITRVSFYEDVGLSDLSLDFLDSDCVDLKQLKIVTFKNAEGLSRILDKSPNLHYLNLKNLNIDHSSVKAISRCVNLETLIIISSILSVEIGDSIQLLPELKTLVINHTKISSNDIKSISLSSSILNLKVLNNDISSLETTYFSKMSQLKTLGIGGPQITDEVVEILSELNNLEGLLIEKSKVTGSAFKFYKNGSLENLDLSDSSINDEGIKSILKISTLKLLILSGTDISRKSLETIHEMPNLQQLYLQPVDIPEDDIQRFVKEHPNIEVSYYEKFNK